MLGKFQSIEIAKRSYWLKAFLTKSKSIITENVLNQWKTIKILQIAGCNRNFFQMDIKIHKFKFIRFSQPSKTHLLIM